MQKLEDLRLAYRDIRGAGAGSDPTDPFDLAAPDQAEKTEKFRESFGDTPLPKKFAEYNLGAHDRESDPHPAGVNRKDQYAEYKGIVRDVKGVSERVDPPKESSLNLGGVPLAELARMDFADTSGGRDSLVNFVEGRGDSLTIDGIQRYIDAQESRKNLVMKKREETARKRRSAGPYDDPGLQDTYDSSQGVGSRAGRTAVDADIKERNRIDKNIEMARDVMARLEKAKRLTAATSTAKN
jgi:hypothetical protein